MVKINERVPDFRAQIQTGAQFCLSEACADNAILLFFYPKDMTSGCTKEAEGFRDHYDALLTSGIRVVGVSKDSMKSHVKFIEKYELPFDLIADTEKVICDLFGCMVEKSMYGRKYLGIDRSTFLIGQDQTLKHEWRNVKVPGHVDEVVNTVLAEHHE